MIIIIIIIPIENNPLNLACPQSLLKQKKIKQKTQQTFRTTIEEKGDAQKVMLMQSEMKHSARLDKKQVRCDLH